MIAVADILSAVIKPTAKLGDDTLLSVFLSSLNVSFYTFDAYVCFY